MNIDEILGCLRAERDRVNAAIAALDNRSAGHGRRRGPKISAEGRKRISEAMKKRWAERRKKARTTAA